MRKRKKIVVLAMIAGGLCLGVARDAWSQKPPLLPEKDVAALANELSGETAKRNLEVIATFHRQRGSRGFHSAAELVAERARAYGLSDVQILEFPADGKIFYGTQRSRPAWDAEFGELWERGDGIHGCEQEKIQMDTDEKLIANSDFAGKEVLDHSRRIYEDCLRLKERETRLASYGAEPVVLAEDSESADVTAELVDVGGGTREADYTGKDVKGKIVLVSASPGAVQDLAVAKFGAAGIVSYAQNQKTAWWGEDENLIRWGHLETFSEHKTFAFMVSLKTARGLRERLTRGEKITLHAVVKAGQHAGNYEVVTATIPGADAKLKEEEIAFSCHLDHQRPGANDNASGCVTILEVARTLQKLISEGKLARPARTIRFIWPPEIEGTMALLNSDYDHVHPLTLQKRQPIVEGDREQFIEHIHYRDGTAFFPYYKHIKAVMHMDMVGGGPETKAVFHVTRGPMSLPSFVHDVAWAFAEFVNEESYKFAATGKAEYPFVAPEGGKEPLRAEYSAYTMGSDHDVYQDSSFGIPAIYLNDWPDRYIHTNFDTAANIDTTKLKRAAFIGAASGYFLAGMDEYAAKQALGAVEQGRYIRAGDLQRRLSQLQGYNLGIQIRSFVNSERIIDNSIRSEYPALLLSRDSLVEGFISINELSKRATFQLPATGGNGLRFVRSQQPKGPLAVFGYDYFADHAKAAGVTTPKLMSYEGRSGTGEEYAYEVLNFADGKRNVLEIQEAVSAEYGWVSVEMVTEYLRALEKIGVVAEMK